MATTTVEIDHDELRQSVLSLAVTTTIVEADNGVLHKSVKSFATAMTPPTKSVHKHLKSIKSLVRRTKTTKSHLQKRLYLKTLTRPTSKIHSQKHKSSDLLRYQDKSASH